MAKMYTLCLAFVIVACVKTQEVVDPESSADEDDTVILTEEDNLTNEIVTDPLAVSDATEPAIIAETIPSTDDGEIGETTTSQESQPDAPAEDDETTSPENVPDVAGEDGEIDDAANEGTLPDPPAADDEVALAANPEALPDVPGEDENIGDTENPGAEEDEINETSPENLPDPPAEDTAPLPTEEVTSENPPTTPADTAAATSPPSDANSPQTPSEQTTPVILTENTIPDRPFPSITISLPTFWPSTVISTNGLDTTRPADTHICKENEIYSCLPFCMKTCNNPMSKFLCRPVPNHFRLCRRGCICKVGYLLEHPNGRCVNECPTRQLF
ncbi:hypothetical protein HUJ04_003476 [Dendroctonus ponderosae]|uniref:TIL domain-containing protein n=1 Tax=Dendroctonus ponderosae TaxID=77166 RepID=A0AAR5QC69_DENPD|nr:hypothetical protein HUJ04_003476 [Dendroctonus ponderosae]